MPHVGAWRILAGVWVNFVPVGADARPVRYVQAWNSPLARLRLLSPRAREHSHDLALAQYLGRVLFP